MLVVKILSISRCLYLFEQKLAIKYLIVKRPGLLCTTFFHTFHFVIFCSLKPFLSSNYFNSFNSRWLARWRTRPRRFWTFCDDQRLPQERNSRSNRHSPSTYAGQLIWKGSLIIHILQRGRHETTLKMSKIDLAYLK